MEMDRFCMYLYCCYFSVTDIHVCSRCPAIMAACMDYEPKPPMTMRFRRWSR
ncbi:hypothetical protein ASPWEDRAFT_37053 [Aspergillus wentii DTO 134E9]|uniref:Uncharacterized protein n=1 Tax=Aspergillus wentii DTO 134E9 TaxID=1073089 RepID=A0A1L9RWJ6_ASPWE|nr:uncharacterized protein ASPWEDRAFT_37053 [Aspergillus wentii DTO 134E9]OJJ39295.1 hypothetical protein ASPWEDRAFT_37053 [Aspergillus wentii DTO 134E9]